MPQTSMWSTPASWASTHFLMSAGITWDEAGSKLSPGPYRFTGIRWMTSKPYCARYAWPWTRSIFFARPYGAFVSSG